MRFYWWLTIGFLLAFTAGQVFAQHRHAQGHSEYRNWSSERTANCCNDQDCASVDDAQFKETAAGAFIRIEGEWCPILSTHYLIRGKSPDWAVNHACIAQNTSIPPCERLLCFSKKGGF